jgi:hypothetical protein
VSIASLAVIPILSALGFATAGPVVGSIAAKWQSCIGIVGAGSIFAWCQSAAMGGAAVSEVIATGLSGASVAVVATFAGRLGGIDRCDLKERFLAAWDQDMSGEVKKTMQKNDEMDG